MDVCLGRGVGLLLDAVSLLLCPLLSRAFPLRRGLGGQMRHARQLCRCAGCLCVLA